MENMENRSDLRKLNSEQEIGNEHAIQIFDRRIAYTIPHWHDFFEVELILDGHGTYNKNGHEFPFSPGLTCFMSTTDFHHFVSEDGIAARVIAIGFGENIISEKMLSQLAELDRNNHKVLSTKALERAEMAVSLLKHEREINGSHQTALLEYLLCLVTGITKDTETETTTAPRDFNNVLRYMEWHFRENLTLLQMAEMAGYTDTYFSELFRKTIGMTFTEKLTELRLEYACSLLENGYSVAHACFESGFGSLSNFHAAFQKKYHISPGRFKKSPREFHVTETKK